MEIMDLLNIALAAVSLCLFASGTSALVTGRAPSFRVTEPEQIRKIGVGLLLMGMFWALQVVGYAGVRLGLISSTARGVLLLAAFPVGALAVMKYLPRPTWNRAADDKPDQEVTRRGYPYWIYVGGLSLFLFVSVFVLGMLDAPRVVGVLVIAAVTTAILLPLYGPDAVRKWIRR
ncbi:hypothetical protein [Actinoplanes regularis]|nr:hypothetical protein [Actinoplanes regularis]